MAKRERERRDAGERAAPRLRSLWPLAALLAAGFLGKLATLLALGGHPLLQPDSGLDTGAYVRLAIRVASGDLLLRGEGPVPFFVSPLYVYFLAPLLRLAGGSLFTVRLAQILLGTAAVGLVWATARRLFGEGAAAVGAGLYVLTGVVTFHEVLILQAALDPFLTALALYLLAVGLTQSGLSSKVKDKERGVSLSRSWALLGTWVAAGVAFGLLSLNRPNVLPFAGVVVLALAVASTPLVARSRAGSPRSPSFEEGPFRTLRFAAAYLFGVALAIAPVTLRNLSVSHEFILISSHGGLNFYVGNNPDADGTYHLVPGITPSITGQAADAKRVAEAEEGRSLSTREVSAHFARKAWGWIAAQPGAAARLFVRKVWYVLSQDEIPLNFSYPWYRDRTAALKLLPVGMGLLVPLGGAGLVLGVLGASRLPRREFAVWAAFVPVYVLLVAAFFVATRYRLPLGPPLAAGAGGMSAGLLAALQGERRRGLVPAGLTALVLSILALAPTGLWNGAADEEMHLVLWEIEQGKPDAFRHAEAAASAHPDPPLVWLRVGESFEAAGMTDEAIGSFRRSLEAPPGRPDAAKLLAALLEKRGAERVVAGDAAGARPDLEEAVRLDSSSPSAHLNLGAVLAEAGDRPRARAEAAEALRLKPGYGKAEALLKALEARK